MNEKSVVIKVSGKTEIVKKFLEQLQTNYEICQSSTMKQNDDGTGVHCFVTLIPDFLIVKIRTAQ